MTNKKQRSFLIRMLKRVVGFKEACKVAKDLVSCYDFRGNESLMDIVKVMLDNYYNYRASHYCPFEESHKELVYNEFTNKLDTAQCLYLGKMRLTVTTHLYIDPWDDNDRHVDVTVKKASILLKEWVEDAPYALNGEHHAVRCYWDNNKCWRRVHTISYEDVFSPHDYCEEECSVITGLKSPW